MFPATGNSVSREMDDFVKAPMENRIDNPVLSAIFRRRSIREFTDEAVPLEQLRRIVEAGIWLHPGLTTSRGALF